MHKIITVISLCLLTIVTKGQLKQKVGEILISDSLTQFEIKNDSLIDRGDFEGVFKILNNNQDSLILLPLKYFKSGIFKMDTLKFITVKKRIIPIKNFQLLIIEQYGNMGEKKLVIKNDKTVSYSNDDYPGRKTNTFKMSDKKYYEFIDTLSKCLVFMIPFNKPMGDVFDPTYTNFTFQSNGQYFKMAGIDFSKIHYTLYKYLMFNLIKPQ